MDKAAHIKAVEWALSKGYVMSVKDYSEPDYDLHLSDNEQAILDAIDGTELANVTIWKPDAINGAPRKYHCVTRFSVIDEGVPEETINDYWIATVKAPQWRQDAVAEFEAAVSS